MLKAHWRLISRIERILDNLLVVAAFLIAYYLRDYFLLAANTVALPFPQELKELAAVDDYYLLLGVALPLYNAFLSLLGAYRSMRFSSVFHLLRVSVLSSGLVFLCEGSVLFLLKLDLSRSYVAIFCVLCAIFHFGLRLCVLMMLRFFRVRGKNFRNVLIVGTGPQVFSRARKKL